MKIVKPHHARTVRSELAVHRALARNGASVGGCVAELKESFEVQGHPCLVTELFGEELGAFLEDWELKLDDAKRVARDILLGLKSLHDAGIAHTDLKPANVVYNPDCGRAKLIDFSTATEVFRQGQRFGTREYRAPELLLECPWNTGVDIWSAACAIYEIVTGELLFDVHARVEQVRNWVRKPIRVRFDAYREALDRNKNSGSGEVEQHAEETLIDGGNPPLFGRQSVLNGRYVLVSVLGEGHFSVVWKAIRLPEHLSLPKGAGAPSEPSSGEREPTSLSKRSTSAVGSPVWESIYEQCLAYAHFISIQECLGSYPFRLARDGENYRGFFTRKKRLKFNPRFRYRSLCERLSVDHGFSHSEAAAFSSFLAPMLEYDPRHRARVESCLAHPWLEITPIRRRQGQPGKDYLA